MSVDPLAEQFPGWNPYHYVHNNPINLIDPTGMAADGWRENKETGEVKYDESYTSGNTDSDVDTYFDGGVIGNTVYHTNGATEPFNIDSDVNTSSSDVGDALTASAGVALTGYSAYNVSNGMFRGASGNYYTHAGRKGWNQYTGIKAQMNSTLSKAKWANRGAYVLGALNYRSIGNQYRSGEIGDATFGIEMTSNTIGTFATPVISIPWTIGYEGLGRNGVARIPWYQNTFKPWARKKIGIDE